MKRSFALAALAMAVGPVHSMTASVDRIGSAEALPRMAAAAAQPSLNLITLPAGIGSADLAASASPSVLPARTPDALSPIDESALLEESPEAPPADQSRVEQFPDDTMYGRHPAAERLAARQADIARTRSLADGKRIAYALRDFRDKILGMVGVTLPQRPLPREAQHDVSFLLPRRPICAANGYQNVFHLPPGTTLEMKKLVDGDKFHHEGRWKGSYYTRFLHEFRSLYGDPDRGDAYVRLAYDFVLYSGAILKPGMKLTVSRWPRILFASPSRFLPSPLTLEDKSGLWYDVFIEIPLRLENGTHVFLVAMAEMGSQQSLNLQSLTKALLSVADVKPRGS